MTPTDRAAMDDARPTREEAQANHVHDWVATRRATTICRVCGINQKAVLAARPESPADDARPTRAEAIEAALRELLAEHDDTYDGDGLSLEKAVALVHAREALARPEAPVARSVAGEAVAWELFDTSSETPCWFRCDEDAFRNAVSPYRRRALGVIEAAPQPSSQAVEQARREGWNWAIETAFQVVMPTTLHPSKDNPTRVIWETREHYADLIRALAPQPTERARSGASEEEL